MPRSVVLCEDAGCAVVILAILYSAVLFCAVKIMCCVVLCSAYSVV